MTYMPPVNKTLTHTYTTQHADQTFYNFDGSVNRNEHNVHIYCLDYLGIAPIAEVSPVFREAKQFPCEGLYCSEPTYIPMRHMIK